MPRVRPENRKRAKKPKTNSGCYTCKVRRVKCDEARPYCFRCKSTGRRCDGYENKALGDITAANDPVRSAPGIFESWNEHRAYAYFVERTRWQLTGSFECEFWNRVLLQAAQYDIAVRNAVIALGSLHEKFESADDGHGNVQLDDFATRRYNSAIRQHLARLAQPDNSDDLESYLASCMVFVAIETIQAHYASAMSLIKSATELLHDQVDNGRVSSAYPVKSFESMLRRLQLQAAGLLTTEYAVLGMPPLPQATGDHCIPASFSSLTEAKDFLEIHGYSSHLSRRNTQPPFVSGPTRFVGQPDWLTRWISAFDVTLRSLTLTERDRRAADILTMRVQIFQIIAGIRKSHLTTSPNEMSWDCWKQSFAKILHLAERVCTLTTIKPIGSSRVAQTFCVDFGWVGPIYDTARVCRCPVLRRKAVEILRTYPCREGLWDSRLAVRCAEKQIELEESCVDSVKEAADVPDWARIVDVVPRFQAGQRWAPVVFSRQKVIDHADPLQFHEIIEW